MPPTINLPPFEELAALAKDNPEQLTQLRQELCDQLINSCSGEMQMRLAAQQSHIERTLQRAKNPIHANILLRNELHKQIVKFSNALRGDVSHSTTSATILPFSPKQDWR